MKLSIIVPAHNEEQYIGKCLSSLLNQTYKDYEIIVVNDGSTDRTEAIVKDLQKKSKKIKLISFKEGHSAAFARNRGAEKAKGGILVFIDADQFVKKDFLNRIAKNFENKKIGAITGKVLGASKTFIGKCFAARKMVYWVTRQTKKQISNELPLFGILAIRKKIFSELGGYDENLFYLEDFIFLEKFRKKYLYSLLFDPSIITYHYDPADLNEFYRYSLWFGKGIASKLKKFGCQKVILPLATIFFWPLFLLICVSSFFFPLLKWVTILMVLFSLIELFKTWYYSKDFIHSFGFILLSVPRGFISVYSFLKNL
jgi:cellulose synthase/poly-beta-1,6-N-acetylglucosamine synthase-like glycosyltransferase